MSIANSTPTGRCVACGKPILPALGKMVNGETFHVQCVRNESRVERALRRNAESHDSIAAIFDDPNSSLSEQGRLGLIEQCRKYAAEARAAMEPPPIDLSPHIETTIGTFVDHLIMEMSNPDGWTYNGNYLIRGKFVIWVPKAEVQALDRYVPGIGYFERKRLMKAMVKLIHLVYIRDFASKGAACSQPIPIAGESTSPPGKDARA